jgi:hypothetical protein
MRTIFTIIFDLMNIMKCAVICIGLVGAVFMTAWANDSDGIMRYIPMQSDYIYSKESNNLEKSNKPENEFCTTVTDISYDECKVLEELYNATNGSDRTDDYKWMRGAQVCTWF